jgi:GGDEF domain-containing protein
MGFNGRQHLAVTDELTGLGNRRRLLDELEEVFAALSHKARLDQPNRRDWQLKGKYLPKRHLGC